MAKTYRRSKSWKPVHHTNQREKDHLREEIEEGMSFYSNVTPKRFGAGRPKDKPVEQEKRSEKPEKADSSAADEDA